MKINNIKLKNNLIFAPIAGFSTPPVRRLMAENNAGLTITEMVSVKALLFNSKKTNELLVCDKSETVKCVQLFGNDPAEFYDCVSLPILKKFDIIDINMGCPVKKIVSNKEGSALIGYPVLAAQIVSAIKKAGKTVTVKTRLGINERTEILKFAPYLFDAGVDMLTVHGRTAKQMYSGTADYDSIAAVKRLLPNLLLTANGDVTDKQSYLNILTTGADAVMIGRGALSNPLIFWQLLNINNPVNIDRKQLLLRLISYTEEFFLDRAIVELKKFLPYFLKGIRGSKEIRQSLNFATDINKLKEQITLLPF